MRTKPRGSRCKRKRRRNSSTGRVMSRFLLPVGGVAPAEGDVAVGESNQPAVGNGDTMGVGAEIAQHMFWHAERPFGVDDPVVTEQYPQPCGKGARFRKR